MYFIVSHFYHEPPAREIGQPLPVYLTVNKLYLYLYDTLKKVLCEGPVLAFQRFDLPFILLTDPSTTCVAAVLS